jgi:hypothetical protein
VTETLLARKGEAVPTGLSAGNRHALAYFAARRMVTFGQIDRPRPQDRATTVEPAEKPPAKQRPVALILAPSCRKREARHRFTFRLDRDAYAQFRAVAAAQGCSGQKLLERALERLLDDLDVAPATAAPLTLSAVPLLV